MCRYSNLASLDSFPALLRQSNVDHGDVWEEYLDPVWGDLTWCHRFRPFQNVSLDIASGVRECVGLFLSSQGATVASATTQFHWQDPSLSTECSRCEKPSACFPVLGVAGSSPGRTSYPKLAYGPPK